MRNRSTDSTQSRGCTTRSPRSAATRSPRRGKACTAGPRHLDGKKNVPVSPNHQSQQAISVAPINRLPSHPSPRYRPIHPTKTASFGTPVAAEEVGGEVLTEASVVEAIKKPGVPILPTRPWGTRLTVNHQGVSRRRCWRDFSERRARDAHS